MHNIKQKCDHLSTTFITCYYLVIFEFNWMNSCKNLLFLLQTNEIRVECTPLRALQW